MGKQLNGRLIQFICNICAIRHGKIKEPTQPPSWTEGTCDICEETGNANVIQSVASPEYFGGVSGELLPFEEYKEPKT
jgi:hypothetical protein